MPNAYSPQSHDLHVFPDAPANSSCMLHLFQNSISLISHKVLVDDNIGLSLTLHFQSRLMKITLTNSLAKIVFYYLKNDTSIQLNFKNAANRDTSYRDILGNVVTLEHPPKSIFDK